MITREKYIEINNEIKLSITSALDKLRNLNLGNYILFLSDAEYVENSYRIDDRLDKYKDSTRIKFLSKFLNNYYAFPTSQMSTDDDSYRMNLELMIYSHLWESKSYLKKLYRFAHLLNNESYQWKVEVPSTGKHDFIRTQIREVFKKNDLNISKVIENGFHTSLRNAFAHSQYSFDRMNGYNRINLYNYNKANWELKTISFDDWSSRFVYSALLGYNFLKIILDRRLNLVEENGTNLFEIKLPIKTEKLVDTKIKYSKENNAFSEVH